MEPDLQAKVNEWLEWDRNSKTRSEIENLVKDLKYDELKSRLFNRMEFGTAGLRSRMGAGYSMMNDLTIIQTAQGFLKYLQGFFGEKLNQQGIVIGYDARHNSKRFAELTASIFLRANVPVYLFRQITPTPFVPYSILKYKCSAGVMVTASHNPKDDNGYKVYFDNGAQIIPPHDKGIANAIEESLTPRPESWETESMLNSSLKREPFDEVYQSYFSDLSKHLCFHRELNSKTNLKFTYTAMHGVGYEFSVESFKSFNLVPFIPVKEQIVPDPEFPTVSFPNPEEGKSALNLAIKTANENESTIILANDPDADRLAVAEKNSTTNEWKIFNGNEIGALLGWWLWHSFKNNHKAEIEQDPSFVKNAYMLYSTVSSQILKSIAEVEGFNSEDTLTGFKWMGNRAHDLIQQNKHIIFCFEEAIGFLCGANVLDKDGVSAESVVAEMAVYLNHHENKTLLDQLNWIYETYGFHTSNNSYYLCYQQQKLENMFERLRHYNGTSGEDYSYPKTLGPYAINKVRDLTAGVQLDLKTNEKTVPTFPTSKSSQMLTFYFDNGCILTIRTSGTEPKIKWYSEIRQLDKSKTRDEIRNELDDLVKHMIDEFYQPEINGFKARTT